MRVRLLSCLVCVILHIYCVTYRSTFELCFVYVFSVWNDATFIRPFTNQITTLHRKQMKCYSLIKRFRRLLDTTQCVSLNKGNWIWELWSIKKSWILFILIEWETKQQPAADSSLTNWNHDLIKCHLRKSIKMYKNEQNEQQNYFPALC